jgi:hypothetical protein
MAATAAGRRDDTGLGPAGAWHTRLVRIITVYAGARACLEAQAREREASACVGARWRGGQTQSGLTTRLGWPRTGDDLRMRAREWACGLKNNSMLTPCAWIGTTEGGTSARRGGTPARSTSVEGQGDERVGLLPFFWRTCVRAWVHVAWMRVKVRACARRGHGHGDGRDHGDDTTTGRNERQNKKGRAASGAARTAKSAAAPARNKIPSLA